MAKFGVKEVADCIFWDLVTGKPLLYLDTLKMTNLENTAQSSSARGGKGNPKLLTWDFGREATMQVQDALMTEKSLALLSGNPLVTGADVYKRVELVAVAGVTGKTKVTLASTPIGGEVFVYTLDGNENNEEITSTLNVLDVEFDELDVAIGTTVAVYYRTNNATASKISITSDSFPSYVRVTGDTVVRNASTGVDESFQIVIHKAKVQPGFTLTLQADGDPSVFDLNLEIFKADDSTAMVDLIRYED